MKITKIIIFVHFSCSWFVHADTYVWEDYDDFSGSSLDTNKWGTKYLGGGIEPYVANGKLVLSGNSGNPSATKVVKSGWEDVFAGDDGGQSWVYAKDSDIVGIESEFLIPSSASSKSSLQLGVASLSPLSYATAELNADPNSPSQYSNGFGFYHFLNGSETENFGTTQRDTTHKLGATLIDGTIKLYVDGETRYEGEAETFNTDMFYLNGFNDYQSQGLEFELTADNARVLRRVTTTTLDGSVLMLSSTDGVSETLAFENGTFTSTFTDPEEGTMVTANQTYILDQNSENSFKITLSDGDTYEFDASTNTGTLIDYEDGVADDSGSWNFNFSRHDWEDYDDFSGGSLDPNKWDIAKWDGGNFPVLEGGVLKFDGLPNSANSVDVATSAMLAAAPDGTVGDPSSLSPHSILEFKESKNLAGIELTFSMPSGVPNEMGFGLYAVDYEAMLHEIGQESAIRFSMDLWAENSKAYLEYDTINSSTGIEEEIDKNILFNTSYRVAFIRSDSQISFYMNGELVGEYPYSSVDEYFIVRAMNEINQPFTTYLENVRVLRRSQETTEPDPVTVVSDPNGQAVVVQVGEEYKWSSNLNGVTLWSVDQSGGDIQPITMRFENGRNFGNEGFYDSVALPQPYDMPFVIDENGYIKVTEDSGYQYYHVVSVENGVIATLEGDEQGVVDDGVSVADQWFFTTRAAAEEYYYSKVNPKDWMWFDHYPWVYSNEEQDWLYFHPSGGTLMYWSNKGQAWRQFN